MRPKSAKSKGRNAQKLVKELLLKYAPHLTENDIRSTSMGVSGVDILLSEAAIKTYPFSVEVKCQEKLNIWDALEQAKANSNENTTPLLCFKRNRTDIFVALSLDAFLNLLTKNSHD